MSGSGDLSTAIFEWVPALTFEKVENIEKGKKGESVAAVYLRSKGYRIKERNKRVGRKEIDIIAELDKTLVIVEVKWRATSHFGQPEEGLTKKQQRNLIEAADEYVKKVKWEGDVRYDIVAIVQTPNQRRILHIEDAFWPFVSF